MNTAQEALPYDRLPAEQEYLVNDLLLWRDGRRGVRTGVSPDADPVIALPNGDIAAVFFRGEVRCVRGTTGRRSWSLPENRYASGWAAVGSRVFVNYTHRVVCLDEKGTSVWEHTPYPDASEWIYSSPVVSGDRLFYGDRQGYLNCLDATTGQLKWEVLTSRARNNHVNSTAVVVGDRVIVAGNSRKVMCFDQATGNRIWQSTIDEPCGDMLLYRNGSVWFSTFMSLYEVSPEDGKVLNRIRFRGNNIVSFEVTPDTMLLVVRPSKGPINFTGEPGHLCGFRKGEEVFRSRYARYVGPRLTYDVNTDYVYETENIGIGVLDPVRGTRIASIRGFHPNRHGYYSDDRTTPPLVTKDAMYVATNKGAIIALRTPWNS